MNKMFIKSDYVIYSCIYIIRYLYKDPLTYAPPKYLHEDFDDCQNVLCMINMRLKIYSDKFDIKNHKFEISNFHRLIT